MAPPDGLGQQSALVFLQAKGKLVVHGPGMAGHANRLVEGRNRASVGERHRPLGKRNSGRRKTLQMPVRKITERCSAGPAALR
jgi:hypothetical protein